MEFNEIKVKIIRNKEEKIELDFQNERIRSIILSDEPVNDLKAFFNDIFQYIIETKKMINFSLIEDEKTDLFYDVTKDIVAQLNSEIKQSEDNFSKIINLSSCNEE